MQNEATPQQPLKPGHILCRACGRDYAPMTSDPPTTYISKRVMRTGAVLSIKVPVYPCPNCHFKNFLYAPGDVPYVPEPRESRDRDRDRR